MRMIVIRAFFYKSCVVICVYTQDFSFSPNFHLLNDRERSSMCVSVVVPNSTYVKGFIHIHAGRIPETCIDTILHPIAQSNCDSLYS